MLSVQKDGTRMFRVSNLKRMPSGAWKARKGIPADVRAEYQVLYEVGWEALFHAPRRGTPAQRAKVLHAEWLALVEGRIEALRAVGSSKAADLTQRQADALAAEWYRWFTGQHLDNPGQPQTWSELQEVWWNCLIDTAGDPETGEIDTEAAAELHPALAAEARADRFLTDRGVVLPKQGQAAFFSALAKEFVEATKTLQRRAGGDWGPDHHEAELAPSQRLAARSTGRLPPPQS
jgi:hypothetical protein